MVASDNLFRLIKALDMNEKRYFKLFASLYEKKKHSIELFDSIEKQSRKLSGYNETELKKTIKNKMLVKQLAFYKNYLYEQILKCLRLYHSSKTIAQQVRELIDCAQILFQKRQFDESYRLLKRAKKISKDNDLFLYEMEIEKMESTIAINTQNVERMKELSGKESNTIYDKFKNERNYILLSSKFYLLINKIGRANTKVQTDKYKSIRNNPLLKNKKNSLSGVSLSHYYHLNGLYYSATNDLKKASDYFFRGNDHLTNTIDNTGLILRNIGNGLAVGSKYISFEKANMLLDVIKNLKPISSGNKREIMATYYLHFMSIYSQHAKFGECKNIVKEVENWIHTNPIEGISKMAEIQIYFNLVHIHFILRDYKKTLYWLRRIIDDREPDRIQDAYRFAWVLNLIIHIDMGNDNLLSYITKSTYRFLAKQEEQSKTEIFILNFIKSRIIRPNTKVSSKTFIEMKEGLTTIFKDPLEAAVFHRFEIIAWLDCKIQKRPLAEILIEKAKKMSQG
jgi:hypothetical protein